MFVQKTKFFILAACILAGGVRAAFSQTLEVVPSRALADQSPVIRVEKLSPDERISITADLTDGGGRHWASQAEFVANTEGTVDTSTHPPTHGSYSGISAAGLIWSMKPEDKHVAAYQSPAGLGAQIINFHLIRNGQTIANAAFQQLAVDDAVRQIKVEGEIQGILLLPHSQERVPGILVVGGSEGGIPIRKAAWLASRGYAAFALAYFGYGNLPAHLENIPLEYFGAALAWMRERPEILPDHIAVVGTSRGGELALQLGSMYPHISAVVAYVPANFRIGACCGNTLIPYAWTWRGQALAFARTWNAIANPAVTMRAEIAVEQTNGPILLISGDDDGVWPSTEMANAVAQRLKHAHFPYSYEHLKYPHAGHRAGWPGIIPTWHHAVANPITGREENLGGNAQGDAPSSIDAIPKVLDFLHESLTASHHAN